MFQSRLNFISQHVYISKYLNILELMAQFSLQRNFHMPRISQLGKKVRIIVSNSAKPSSALLPRKEPWLLRPRIFHESKMKAKKEGFHFDDLKDSVLYISKNGCFVDLLVCSWWHLWSTPWEQCGWEDRNVSFGYILWAISFSGASAIFKWPDWIVCLKVRVILGVELEMARRLILIVLGSILKLKKNLKYLYLKTKNRKKKKCVSQTVYSIY